MTITKADIEAQTQLEIEDFLKELGVNPEAPQKSLTGSGWYFPEQVLRKYGYERLDFDTNGWDYDYWVYFTKDGSPKLCVSGCGHTGSAAIGVDPDDDE